MDVSVIVAAGTTSTRDTLEHPTIGALADAVAQTHAVQGDVFTLKIDGRVADRNESTNFGPTFDGVLELVEIPNDDPIAEPVAAPSNVTVPDTDDAEPTEN